MKLLYDENLSPKFVTVLADVFPESTHVDRIGMDGKSDNAVWSYAKKHGYILVSKDSDFFDKSTLLSHPPKVIWIRRGNCSNRQIQLLLRNKADVIYSFQRKRRSIVYTDTLSGRDIREYVKNRKISGSTRSDSGRQCTDTVTNLNIALNKDPTILFERFFDFHAQIFHNNVLN